MKSTGAYSTEFWLTVLVLILGFVLVLAGPLASADYWKFAVGAAGLYAVSRGLAKNEPRNG